jgi:hypothetical protein
LTVTSTVEETRFVFRMPTRRFGAPPDVARSSAGIGSYGT